MILTNQKKDMFLIMIFPLLFALLPLPNNATLESLRYPAIMLLLIFIGIKWFINSRINRTTLYLLTVLFIYAITIAISLVFTENIRLERLFQIAKPFYFAAILLFGLFVARKNDEKMIVKGLLNVSYIIIFAQFLTGLAQLFDISIFDSIYSAEKSLPFGSLTRLVGTTGNPNTFGWIIIQSAVIITLFENKKFKKILWIAISIMLLILSGSRSMLLIMPVILISSMLFNKRKNLKFYFLKFPIYLMALVLSFYALVLFLINYGDSFPYLQQLLILLNGDSLNSIHSFSLRTTSWDQAILNLKEHTGLLTWMFGLGAGTYTDLDNAYLYAVINTGFLGLLVTIVLNIMLFSVFRKVKNKKFKTFGYQYILFSLILGYQADTFSGWTYPAFAVFYAGIAIALIEKEHKIKNEQLKEYLATKKIDYLPDSP